MTFGIKFEDGGEEFWELGVGSWKFDLRSDLSALAGFHHGPPVVHGIFFEQQDFKRAAGAGVFSTESRGDDAGIIEDEDIAGAQVAKEVGKFFMFEAGIGAVEDEEAGLISLRRGLLGDEFGREWKIKIGGLHFGGGSFGGRTRGFNLGI